MTVNMMRHMDRRARADAFASFVMSLYKDKGYEIAQVQRMMTNCRFVKSHRIGLCCSFGNVEMMTSGIVSPMITQKPVMPPNAKKTCAKLTATSPGCPKEDSTIS